MSLSRVFATEAIFYTATNIQITDASAEIQTKSYKKNYQHKANLIRTITASKSKRLSGKLFLRAIYRAIKLEAFHGQFLDQSVLLLLRPRSAAIYAVIGMLEGTTIFLFLPSLPLCLIVPNCAVFV